MALTLLVAGQARAAKGADWKAPCNDGKTGRFRNRRVMELP